VAPSAYPLHFLRSEILEYRLRHVDGILRALSCFPFCGDDGRFSVPAEVRILLSEQTVAAVGHILDAAAALLGGVETTYVHQAQTVFRLQLEHASLKSGLVAITELRALVTRIVQAATAADADATGKTASPAFVEIHNTAMLTLMRLLACAWHSGNQTAAAHEMLLYLEMTPCRLNASKEAREWTQFIEELVFSTCGVPCHHKMVDSACHCVDNVPLQLGKREAKESEDECANPFDPGWSDCFERRKPVSICSSMDVHFRRAPATTVGVSILLPCVRALLPDGRSNRLGASCCASRMQRTLKRGTMAAQIGEKRRMN